MATAVETNPADTWVTMKAAAREMGVSVSVVRRLMAERSMTVRQIPGSRPLVRLAEAREIAQRFTRPAVEAAMSA